MCFPQDPLAPTALADATATTVSLPLVAATTLDGADHVLTQAVVRIVEDPKIVTATASGPVWAELWLRRQAGLVNALLDKGYIRAGGARGLHAVVGIVGAVSFQPGDYLEAQLDNDTGANITFTIEYAVDYQLDPLKQKLACNVYTTLSTEKSAVLIYEAEPKNGSGVGSATGDVTLTIAPAAGDEISSVKGYFQNLDAVNAYIIRAHANEDGTTDTKIYWNYISTGANGLSVAASGFQTIPGTLNPGGAEPRMHSPLQFFFIVPALATGAQIRLGLVFVIQGRKPTVTLVSPTAGATAGAANVNTNKVV